VEVDSMLLPPNYYSDCNATRKNATHNRNHTHIVPCEAQSGLIGQYRVYSPEDSRALIDRSPLLSRPIRVRIDGQFVMHLDVCKRVRRLELNCMSVEEMH
jgi:hypothetical protein